jgi:hypothetical protein
MLEWMIFGRIWIKKQKNLQYVNKNLSDKLLNFQICNILLLKFPAERMNSRGDLEKEKMRLKILD